MFFVVHIMYVSNVKLMYCTISTGSDPFNIVSYYKIGHHFLDRQYICSGVNRVMDVKGVIPLEH